MAIRPDMFSDVRVALGHHQYLLVDDFTLEESSSREGNPAVKVKYRGNDAFSFWFHVPDKKTDGEYKFTLEMKPGENAVTEVAVVNGRWKVMEEIKSWVDRVYRDIVGAPLLRKFKQHGDAIDELKKQLGDLPDEAWTRDEIISFEERLTSVKAELLQELKGVTEDKDMLKARVEALTRDIEFLKQSLDSTTKKTWGQLAMSRIWKWKESWNVKNITMATRLVRLAAPEAVGEELDKVVEILEGNGAAK